MIIKTHHISLLLLLLYHLPAVKAKNKNKNNNNNYNNWQSQYSSNTGQQYSGYSGNSYSGNKNSGNNYSGNNYSGNNYSGNNQSSSNSNNQYSTSASTTICNPYSADDYIDCTTLASKSTKKFTYGVPIACVLGIVGSIWIIRQALMSGENGETSESGAMKKKSSRKKKSSSTRNKKKKSQRKSKRQADEGDEDEEAFQYELRNFDGERGDPGMQMVHSQSYHRNHDGYGGPQQYYHPDPRLHPQQDPNAQMQLDPRLQQHWQRLYQQNRQLTQQGLVHDPRLYPQGAYPANSRPSFRQDPRQFRPAMQLQPGEPGVYRSGVSMHV